MADPITEAKVIVKTIAEGTGAQETAAALKETTAATEAQTIANEDLAKSQVKIIDNSVAKSTGENFIGPRTQDGFKTGEEQAAFAERQSAANKTASEWNKLSTEEDRNQLAAQREKLAIEERSANLLGQRQIIIDRQVEAISAEANGENEVAAALSREVEVRKIALALQGAANIEEEEAFTLAETQVAAQEEINATKQAQAALNEDLIRQEQARIDLNKTIAKLIQEQAAAQEAQAAGSEKSFLDNARPRSMVKNLFGDVGGQVFGALIIYEAVKRAVDKISEDINKAAEAQFKLTEQAEKEERIIKERIAGATTEAELIKARESASEKAADLDARAAEEHFKADSNAYTLIQHLFGIHTDLSQVMHEEADRMRESADAQADQVESGIKRLENEKEIVKQAKEYDDLLAQRKSRDDQYQQNRFNALPLGRQISELSDKASNSQAMIEGFGVKSENPDDAYTDSKRLPVDQQNAVLKYITEWQQELAQLKQKKEELERDKKSFEQKNAEEEKRRKEKAKKDADEKEKLDKENAPFADRGKAIAEEVISAAPGNFKDQQVVRDAAKKLAADPLNADLAAHLRDLLEPLMEHTAALNQAQSDQRQKAFQDARKYVDDRMAEIKQQIANQRPTGS